MAARDYTAAPIADQLGIPSIVAGLCADLDQLRKGEISVNDAMARSMLAKQIFNGVRIYMNGAKLLADKAHLIAPASGIEAASAGETHSGSTEGESPAPAGGDARVD